MANIDFLYYIRQIYYYYTVLNRKARLRYDQNDSMNVQ